MAPLAQATLTAILLLLGTSLAVPAANPADTFTFKAGNATANTTPQKCRLEAATVQEFTFGQAQFKECLPLGNTFDAIHFQRVGNHALNENRCFHLSPNDDCSGGFALFLTDESGDETVCQDFGGPFSFILYTNNCPPGGPGKL